jgi:hypothetical protein
MAWFFLLATILISGAAHGAYAAAGTAPSGRFDFLLRMTLFVVLWNWYLAQQRPHRMPVIFDLGIFLAVLWPILLPHALWARQRWRGVAKVGAIAAAHAVAYLITLLVFYALAA